MGRAEHCYYARRHGPPNRCRPFRRGEPRSLALLGSWAFESTNSFTFTEACSTVLQPQPHQVIMWGWSASPPPPPEPTIPIWVWNAFAALIVLAYIKTVIGVCDMLVKSHSLLPSDSRKVVHVAAGSWLLFWNLFDESHWTWQLNIFVPAAFTLTLALKGAIIRDPKDPDVRTMSRTGEPYELLLGPLFFTVVMDIVGLYCFRTQVGALMMGALGVGDGIAPVAGARGTHRYKLLGRAKTLEGSAACFVGCVVGSAMYLHMLGLPAVTMHENLILAAVATAVEAVSPPDVDNLLMPLAVWYVHTYGLLG